MKIVSHDPATLEVLGSVNAASTAGVRRAVSRARQGLKAWGTRPLDERIAIIETAADIMAGLSDELALMISREEGKPLSEAEFEATDTPDRIRYFASKAREALSPSGIPGSRVPARIERRPVGVVGALMPWNFPLSIPIWTIAPALLAGNAVVFKPSELTPLVGEAIGEIFHEAGVPRDLFVIIHGGDGVGKAMVSSGLDMIAFVGSQAAGRHIARRAAPAFKRLALEMGGKDPALVLPGADIEAAVRGIARGAFKNCGQVCCSIERVYIDRSIRKDFIDLLVSETESIVMGRGIDPDVRMGPMIREAERRRVERFVRDARSRGGRILTGGGRPRIGLPGAFHRPTIILDPPADSLILTKETFGPALGVVTVRNSEDAVRRANSLPFGLTASVWTEDSHLAKGVASELRAGTIAINMNTGSIKDHPWGGVKASGIGRMLGEEGLLEFTETVVVRG